MPLAKSTGAGQPQYIIGGLVDFAEHLEQRAESLDNPTRLGRIALKRDREEAKITARTMRAIAQQLRQTTIKPQA